MQLQQTLPFNKVVVHIYTPNRGCERLVLWVFFPLAAPVGVQQCVICCSAIAGYIKDNLQVQQAVRNQSQCGLSAQCNTVWPSTLIDVCGSVFSQMMQLQRQNMLIQKCDMEAYASPVFSPPLTYMFTHGHSHSPTISAACYSNSTIFLEYLLTSVFFF